MTITAAGMKARPCGKISACPGRKTASSKLGAFSDSVASSFETLAAHGSSECVKETDPHPEELAKQASRRMDATHRLAAILRDARKGALLRMRS